MTNEKCGEELLNALMPASIADRVTCEPVHHLDGYLRDPYGKPKIRLVVEYLTNNGGWRYAITLDRDGGPESRMDSLAFFIFKARLLAAQVRNYPEKIKGFSSYDYDIIRTFGADSDRRFVESERLFRKVALNDEKGWNDTPPMSPPEKDPYSPPGRASRW